nr:MAG TPA: hypothetical protein [Caudoviricetes sp.]
MNDSANIRSGYTVSGHFCSKVIHSFHLRFTLFGNFICSIYPYTVIVKRTLNKFYIIR